MRLLAALAAAVLAAVLAAVAAAPVATAAASPTVTIVSPAADALIEGTVTIAIEATTDPSDPPNELVLEVTDATGATSQVGTYACTGEPCAGTVTWDATGRSGEMTLTAEVVAENDSATSTPVAVSVESPPPTAAITSPAAGSVLKGTVEVELTGSTDPSQSDYPSELALEVTSGGATSEVGTYQCLASAVAAAGTSGGGSSCGGSVSWDASGLSGEQVLTAVVTTADGRSATSPPLEVEVESPAPTAGVTSPIPGAVVQGTVEVDVSGATDPSQSDYPSDIALYAEADGTTTEVGDYTCYGGLAASASCSGSVSWDTSKLAGPETLTAVLTTTSGATATSAPVGITVFAATKLTVTSPPEVRSGRRVRLAGTLATSSGGTPIAGAEVRLAVDPASGAARHLSTRTDAGGSYSFSLAASVNATDHLSVAGGGGYGAASATVRQEVLAAARCSPATGRPREGTSDLLRCEVPALPTGVGVTVDGEVGRRWSPIATASSTRGGASLSLRVPASTGRLPLRLVLAASSAYATTTLAIGSLAVAPRA